MWFVLPPSSEHWQSSSELLWALILKASTSQSTSRKLWVARGMELVTSFPCHPHLIFMPSPPHSQAIPTSFPGHSHLQFHFSTVGLVLNACQKYCIIMCYACTMQSAMHNTCTVWVLDAGQLENDHQRGYMYHGIFSPMTCRLLGLQRLKSR